MFDIVDVVAVREALGRLSPLHQQICALLANGHTQEEIARATHRSQATVSYHISRIRAAFRKAGFEARPRSGEPQSGNPQALEGAARRRRRRAERSLLEV